MRQQLENMPVWYNHTADCTAFNDVCLNGACVCTPANDEDGDGTCDENDLCPGTYAGAVVIDAIGCTSWQ